MKRRTVILILVVTLVVVLAPLSFCIRYQPMTSFAEDSIFDIRCDQVCRGLSIDHV